MMGAAAPAAPPTTAFQALRGFWIYAVPVAVLMFYGAFIYPKFPYISGAFIDDWYAHAMYGTFFLIGYLIGRDAGFWSELSRMRWVTLLAACVFFVLFMLRDTLFPSDAFALADRVKSLIIYSNRWLWILAVVLMFEAGPWRHSLHRCPRPRRGSPLPYHPCSPPLTMQPIVSAAAAQRIAAIEAVNNVRVGRAGDRVGRVAAGVNAEIFGV